MPHRFPGGAIGTFLNVFAYVAARAGHVNWAIYFQSVFTSRLEFPLSRRGMVFAFMYKATNHKYGLEMPSGRTVTRRSIAEVDDRDVRTWIERVNETTTGDLLS